MVNISVFDALSNGGSLRAAVGLRAILIQSSLSLSLVTNNPFPYSLFCKY